TICRGGGWVTGCGRSPEQVCQRAHVARGGRMLRRPHGGKDLRRGNPCATWHRGGGTGGAGDDGGGDAAARRILPACGGGRRRRRRTTFGVGRSCSSSMSPMISSRMSSSVTRPRIFPSAFRTSAIGRCALRNRRRALATLSSSCRNRAG